LFFSGGAVDGVIPSSVKLYTVHVRERQELNRAWVRLRAACKPGSGLMESALGVVFVLLLAIPIAPDPPNVLNLRTARAQEMVDHLRAEMSITSEIDIALVKYHPLVFFVEPEDSTKKRFRLSMEAGFLLLLDDEELLGALAHEMGHVWIYTHHPFLQTEMQANVIGQRMVSRRSFEKVYTKLWAYEHTPGVPMEELLGRPQAEDLTKGSKPDVN
jgi:hypothetical protein